MSQDWPGFLIDAMPWGVVACDEAGLCRRVNRSCALLAGVEEASASGKHWLSLFPPTERSSVEKEWLEALARGGGKLEFPWRGPDGVIRHISAMVMVGTAACAPTVCLALQDREEQRRTDQELSLYRNALENVDIVAITDAKGKIIYANEMFCRISGYGRDELIGCTHRVVNSRRMPPGYFSEMWATISSGKVWTGEICNRAKDGSFYWVDTIIVPALGPDGKPERYISIRRDVTARKIQMERACLRTSEAADTADEDGLLSLWEQNELLREFEGSYDLLADAIGHFRDLAPTLIQRLRESFVAGDLDELAERARACESTFATFRATKVKSKFERISELARKREPGQLGQELESGVKLMDRLARDLQGLGASLHGGGTDGGPG